MGFLTGKTAIITGAGRAVLSDGSCGSIGYGIATAFAKEGANLVITGRNVKKLEEAKKELEAKYGIRVLPVQADVCAGTDNEATVQNVINQAVDTFGGIQVLVNNAQASASGVPLAEHITEQFDLALYSGLYATFYYMKACYPYLAKSKGSVINFASGAGLFGNFGQCAYAAAKVFSMLLGAALQITNAFGDTYIQNFGSMPQYADSAIVKHSVILLSLSQMSETFCILLIPFFLRRFGIKKVMLISMLAWVLRFGFFGIGNPGSGAAFLILSMVVYGVAFDFFNISGSLFVEKETSREIRSSAQGVFMIMTNGFGAFFGSYAAGAVVDAWGWPDSWYIFAGYALVVAVVFALVFKYKHNPAEMASVKH